MPAPASIDAIQALTEWWGDMGVEVDDATVQAYLKVAEGAAPAAPAVSPTPVRRPRRKKVDWVEEARNAAAACDSVEALKAAIEAFEGSPLKAAAEKTAVYDGTPGASLMVIGEGPGPEEDRRGVPFVGPAGQLLDRMLAAIQRDRKENAFITNVNYWRPPGNRIRSLRRRALSARHASSGHALSGGPMRCRMPWSGTGRPVRLPK